jgi:hypothetical protein
MKILFNPTKKNVILNNLPQAEFLQQPHFSVYLSIFAD